GRNASAGGRAEERAEPIWTREDIALGLTPGWMCVNPTGRDPVETPSRALMARRVSAGAAGLSAMLAVHRSAHSHVRHPSRSAARAGIVLAGIFRREQPGPARGRLVRGPAWTDPRARPAAARAYRRGARGKLGHVASRDRGA